MKQILVKMSTKHQGINDRKKKEGFPVNSLWWRVLIMTSLILIIAPRYLVAENNSQNLNNESKILAQADSLLNQGGLDYIKKAMNLYQKAADQFPGNYQTNWKCAKAHYLYSEMSRQAGLPDWKDICKNYGKTGYQYGEKAIALKPGKIEGNIYYGLCVWKYSDGVSIARALAEGLKGSTQDAFEKSYGIDKQFDNGWPMKALGRFWNQLPWPLRDYEDSLRYLEEHHKYFPDDPQSLVYLAETLIELDDKKKAKKLLKKAEANTTDQFYSNRAKELLQADF